MPRSINHHYSSLQVKLLSMLFWPLWLLHSFCFSWLSACTWSLLFWGPIVPIVIKQASSLIASPGVSLGLHRTATTEFLSDAGDPLTCVILYSRVSHPPQLAGGPSNPTITQICTLLWNFGYPFPPWSLSTPLSAGHCLLQTFKSHPSSMLATSPGSLPWYKILY